MEIYVNKETIVKNKIYELFRDLIICPVCNSLMIEPVMCYSCQITFCKKCSKNLKDKGDNCPNKCGVFKIYDIIGKNNLITKFKFKCINGCGEEILFDNIKSHYANCNPNNIKKPIINQNIKFKALNKKQLEELIKKNDMEIASLKSN